MKAQLVQANEGQEQATRCAAALRAGLKALADRLAPQVAAANDARTVHLLAAERCHQV